MTNRPDLAAPERCRVHHAQQLVGQRHGATENVLDLVIRRLRITNFFKRRNTKRCSAGRLRRVSVFDTPDSYPSNNSNPRFQHSSRSSRFRTCRAIGPWLWAQPIHHIRKRSAIATRHIQPRDLAESKESLRKLFGCVALHRKAIATPNKAIASVEQLRHRRSRDRQAATRRGLSAANAPRLPAVCAIDRDERAVVHRTLIEPDAEKHVDDHLLRRRLRTRRALADALQQQLIAVEMLRTIEHGLSPNEDLH